jgi:hypothetical protein
LSDGQSYAATAGLVPIPSFLTTDWLLSQFSQNWESARQRYRKFVFEGFEQPSPWAELRGGALLGNEEFVARYQPQLTEMHAVEKIPLAQRLAHRPALEQLLAQPERRRSENFSSHGTCRVGLSLEGYRTVLGGP